MKCQHDILSLGAGVQSTTLLLMALEGETEFKPQYAIFSDTQCESKKVYKHLNYLKEITGDRIPIIEVTAGNLMHDALYAKARFATMPLFVMGTDGKVSIIRRQCTKEYKIAPVRKQIWKIINKNPYKNLVRQWIGISTDEMHRMHFSDTRYLENYYPLVQESKMNRLDCTHWLIKNRYPVPPKSSCFICPFHSDNYWQDLKENDAEEFEQACEFDEAIRWSITRFKLKSAAYLHDSLKPLRDVDFTKQQTSLFPKSECSGHCMT